MSATSEYFNPADAESKKGLLRQEEREEDGASKTPSPERRYSTTFERLNGQKPYLNVPGFNQSFRRSSDASTMSGLENIVQSSRTSMSSIQRIQSRSPGPPLQRQTWKGWVEASWAKNKGIGLVLCAQFFGTFMNVTTRLLEMDGAHGKAMHPFQVSERTVELEGEAASHCSARRLTSSKDSICTVQHNDGLHNRLFVVR